MSNPETKTDPYAPVSAENEAQLLNTDDLGSSLGEDPQPFDLNAFDELQQKKDAEAEAEDAAQKSAKPEDSPLDRMFVLTLDMATGTVCGLISGNGNKDDRYSLSEKQRKDLIIASEAAGLGAKYVGMFGAETMFWVMYAGSVAPKLRLAADDRRAAAIKAKAAKHKQPEPVGITGLENMAKAAEAEKSDEKQ